MEMLGEMFREVPKTCSGKIDKQKAFTRDTKLNTSSSAADFLYVESQVAAVANRLIYPMPGSSPKIRHAEFGRYAERPRELFSHCL